MIFIYDIGELEIYCTFQGLIHLDAIPSNIHIEYIIAVVF